MTDEVACGVSVPVPAAAGCISGAVVPSTPLGAPALVSLPSPAAHSPHMAALNEAVSPFLGWLVNSASTSSRSARTSSTKPCNAFLGPTSTKTRAPAS